MQAFRHWWHCPNISCGACSDYKKSISPEDLPALLTSLRELSAVVSLMPAQFSLEKLHDNLSGVLWYLLQLDLPLACLSYPLPSLSTLHALIVLFCWFHDLISTPNSVRLIQYCQVTSANKFFMWSYTCHCFYGQRKQCSVLSREQ